MAGGEDENVVVIISTFDVQEKLGSVGKAGAEDAFGDGEGPPQQ